MMLMLLMLGTIICNSVVFCVDGVTSGGEAEEEYLFDFTKEDGANVHDWEEKSDTVRCHKNSTEENGMSKAVLAIHKNCVFRRAIFFALLNPLKSGAGFAGMRAVRKEGFYNLTQYSKLQIRCRGQGQYNGFKILLRHKGLNEDPNYSFEHYFQALNEFATINLLLSEFKAYLRGKKINNQTLDISQISSIGIQMYGGVYLPKKQKGPATLEIDWIKAEK